MRDGHLGRDRASTVEGYASGRPCQNDFLPPSGGHWSGREGHWLGIGTSRSPAAYSLRAQRRLRFDGDRSPRAGLPGSHACWIRRSRRRSRRSIPRQHLSPDRRPHRYLRRHCEAAVAGVASVNLRSMRARVYAICPITTSIKFALEILTVGTLANSAEGSARADALLRLAQPKEPRRRRTYISPPPGFPMAAARRSS
jgi:hypothetical protein